MHLDAATVMLQWAAGGLLFLWFTLRDGVISAGYAKLLRATYGVIAVGSFALGVVFSPVLVRDVSAALVALAAFATWSSARSRLEVPAFAVAVVGLVADVAVGVPVHLVSALHGTGLEALYIYGDGRRTIVVLGASGVGKSTLVNALVESSTQQTGEVRDADQRGRHTTVAVTMLRLPAGGWLIDTPGVRAVSLWTSGHGIERAFGDVFALMDNCRFRDCKHVAEPGCAVQAAVAAGSLDEARLDSMRRLVAEEAALEEEQREFERQSVRRVRRGGTRSMARSDRIAEEYDNDDPDAESRSGG